MRSREVLRLKEGDLICCTECPEYGCDGTPQPVVILRETCGCKLIGHMGNDRPFFYDARECVDNDTDNPCDMGFAMRGEEGPDGGPEITGRKMKLLPKITKFTGKIT